MLIDLPPKSNKRNDCLMKRLSFILILVLALVISAGCDEVETVAVEKNLPKVEVEAIEGSELVLSHDIEGFRFITKYSASNNYRFDKWRITDSKNIKFTANLENLPEGAEVLIEHVHTDICLKATSPQLDGLTQDSMDDSYHGTSQDGFLLTEKYPYENVFAIEGFSKDIIDGWSFYNGSYGQGNISTKRLTEGNLIKNGVYANKMSVVYDVLIKYKGEEQYHVKSIIDEFLIPVYIHAEAE